MMAAVEDSVVLVTGVSGFLGSHIAKLLLEDGRHVRGTIRSLENTARVESLQTLCPEAKYPLELVEADLTKDDGWDKAVEGCSAVVHVASPFPNITTKVVAEEDLVGPARDGTLKVLKTVAKHASTVKRVVLTSSVASIIAEPTPVPDKVYSEEDWTNPEALIDAYSKSKTLAEKAAWDFVKELPDEEKFELAVINPSLIMGPALLEGHKNATSVEVMCNFLNRTYPGVPRVSFQICDVRDVAKAHIQALNIPEAADKRHIITTENVWMKDISTILSKEFKAQGYSIPTGQLPYFVVWMAGLFNRTMRTSILPRVGKEFKLNSERMTSVLNVQPTPLETTLLDMAYSLIDLGIVRKTKKYKTAGSRAEVPVANGDTEEKKEVENTETKEEETNKEKELEPEDKEEKPEIKEEKEAEKPKEINEKETKEASNEEKKEETEADK